jgi:diaminohydroxyphosphoribosylaminopyrimidine deaminase/5-amino-6-(5-phosphoribosylamino)uracil reductase
MDRALFWAARARGQSSPNPMVGAVLVSPDGVVVGQGFHRRAGDPHAEVVALESAGARARGSTLYCTLEPCCHVGRTGPCAPRLVEAGVARVVAAVLDPNPVVRGRGFAYLREHGVGVEVGLGGAAAVALNQPFFTVVREGRPFVVLKAATSLDGRIAAVRGHPTKLTSSQADCHAHRFRAEVDAIGVGVGTVIADDPLLTVRGVYRHRPLTRVVFDRQLRTPPDARLLSTRAAGPVIIVTSGSAAGRDEARARLEAAGAEVLVAPDGRLRTSLELLPVRGINSLLLEGGAAVFRSAWDEDVVDYVRLYVTPHTLGAGALALLDGATFSAAALIERRVEPLGPDVLIEGYVYGPG